MILFTVDEARALKKSIANDKSLKKEYPKFSRIVTAFSVWFFILSSIKELFVATIVISLFKNQPDLIQTWNEGYGFIGLFAYLVASCIDILRLLDIGVIIAVLYGAFTIGDGFGANFVPFLVPIALCFAISWGLIVASNYIINVIVEKKCPKIYSNIETIMRVNAMHKMLLS